MQCVCAAPINLNEPFLSKDLLFWDQPGTSGKVTLVGDTVLTTSGFYGVVIDITDEDVIVEFGSNKNCRIPMQKSAIMQVEKPENN